MNDYSNMIEIDQKMIENDKKKPLYNNI